MPAGESARTMAIKLRTEAERLRVEAERWELGAQGEERVGAALDAADPTTTRVLHDRLLKPGASDANLDHLAVSPAGIHLIDAKNWVGDVTVHEGSLWQHWTTNDGRKSACKNDELQKVRRMAADVQKIIGRAVTPVLCLAGTGGDNFAGSETVRGVHVVPVHRLMEWLQSQSRVMPAEQVATLAVQMSVTFPPATGDAVRVEQADEVPLVRPTTRRRPKAKRAHPRPSGARQRRRRGQPSPAQIILGVVVLLCLLAFGSQIMSAIGRGAAKIVSNGAGVRSTSPAVPPSSTLTPKQLLALDDWRIRAGLYRDNAKPSVLAYVPDSALGSYSDECGTQEEKLTAYRGALVRAPDRQLASAARRFAIATHDYLEACRKNHPVALHHAEAAMTAAASDVNVRYNRLIGLDPTSYNAVRVL